MRGGYDALSFFGRIGGCSSRASLLALAEAQPQTDVTGWLVNDCIMLAIREIETTPKARRQERLHVVEFVSLCAYLTLPCMNLRFRPP